MNPKYDFSGWATRNDLVCTDGRTIRHNAFENCNGKTVPLVWNHQHNEPTNILGHGDLIRNTRQFQSGETLNDDINVANEISIVADPFARENFHKMRYVVFMGAKWKISKVEVGYPRLLLTIGGLYHEQTH